MQADSASTIRGQYPSYRQLLQRLCSKLEIQCPSTLITEVHLHDVLHVKHDYVALAKCRRDTLLLNKNNSLLCSVHCKFALQDLETEVLMHILEQQEHSATPAKLQKVRQSQQDGRRYSHHATCLR